MHAREQDEHNGGLVYIQRTKVQLMSTNRGYVYICVDSDQRHKEKILTSAHER